MLESKLRQKGTRLGIGVELQGAARASDGQRRSGSHGELGTHCKGREDEETSMACFSPYSETLGMDLDDNGPSQPRIGGGGAQLGFHGGSGALELGLARLWLGKQEIDAAHIYRLRDVKTRQEKRRRHAGLSLVKLESDTAEGGR